MKNFKISVIGAGSWGTTIAKVLAETNPDVTLWVYENDVYNEMMGTRKNTKYLPGVKLPENLMLSANLNESVEGMDVVFLGVPSHIIRDICSKIKSFLSPEAIIVNLAKGIENDTLLRMSEVIQQVLGISPERIVALYGPSHAEEVSRLVPTAVVSASASLKTAEIVQNIFGASYFRVYTSNDIIGVELGGSLKNIVAVAAGICDGIGFGDNTKAALITRGLVEISRLGLTLGAQPDTFAGLSGMGDLIVTCMSQHSRNRYVGEKIGKGESLDDIIAGMNMVAEGVKTTKSVHQLMTKLNVEMPIAKKVYDVLFKGENAAEEVKELMGREQKREQFR